MEQTNSIMAKDMMVEVHYLDQYRNLGNQKCNIAKCNADGMFFLPKGSIVLCYEHFLEFKKKFAEKA